MIQAGKYLLKMSRSVLGFLSSIVVTFPLAVVVGVIGLNDTPHSWLGGRDGYLILGGVIGLPALVLAAAYSLFLKQQLFGQRADRLAYTIVLAAMTLVDGLLVLGTPVIAMMNHLTAGSRIIVASACEPPPFFKLIERCNGRSYGFTRVITQAKIAKGQPSVSLPRMKARSNRRTADGTHCQTPEVHKLVQCGDFGLPKHMHCFFCRVTGRGRSSSLLAFSSGGGELVRIWANEIDLSVPQTRPDRLDEYFDTAPYWKRRHGRN